MEKEGGPFSFWDVWRLHVLSLVINESRSPTVKPFQGQETVTVATRISCLGMVCPVMKTDFVMLILKNDYDVNTSQKVDHSNNIKK